MESFRASIPKILGNAYYRYELSSDTEIVVGATITVKCTVTNVFGKIISNKTIELFARGVSQGTQTTNSEGIATWDITFDKIGLWKLRVSNQYLFVSVGGWQWVADYSGEKIHLYHNGTMGMINLSGNFTGITCSANTDYTLATIDSKYASFSVVSHPYSYTSRDRNQLILVRSNKIIYNSTTAKSNATVGIYCTIFYRLATPQI